MNKCLVVILMIFGLISCTVKDKQYYRTNPKELQKAMVACPTKQPKNMSCLQLKEIAVHFNSLIEKLQSSPQGFGNDILKLQETIAKQQADLSKDGSNAELQVSMDKNKSDLAEYLAVVKLLESPES